MRNRSLNAIRHVIVNSAECCADRTDAVPMPPVAWRSGRYLRRTRLALAIVFCLPTLLAQASYEVVEVIPPRYEVTLTAEEFLMLHAAAQSGVSRYGGDADFGVRLQRVGDEVTWRVTITNGQLVSVWGYWMAERTSQLVGLADFEQLDAASKRSFQVARSVISKLETAKATPIWDSTVTTGRVESDVRGYRLVSGSKTLRLVGERTPDLERWVGQQVVATGFIRAAGRLELTEIRAGRQNTLELFVMSYCPFARKAERLVLDTLRRVPAGETRPRLDVRFIFSKRYSTDGESWGSLHGEDEVRENLVQMTLRDQFPEVFEEYLLRRSDSFAPWQQLAKEVGLDPGRIASIDFMITSHRDTLVAKEFEHVALGCGVVDGSPTYLWESVLIPDLRHVPAFASVELPAAGSCSDGR